MYRFLLKKYSTWASLQDSRGSSLQSVSYKRKKCVLERWKFDTQIPYILLSSNLELFLIVPVMSICCKHPE